MLMLKVFGIVFFSAIFVLWMWVWRSTCVGIWRDSVTGVSSVGPNGASCDFEIAKYIENGELNFSAKLVQQLVKDLPEQNFLVSPVAIYRALTLLHEGAIGPTKVELEVALDLSRNLNLSASCLHQILNTINRSLQLMGKRWNFNLVIANTLIAQNGFHFKDQFTRERIVAKNSEVDFRTLDFASWQRYATLFGHEALGSDSLFLLINTFHFDALWANEFDKRKTKKACFTSKPGERPVVIIDMMHSIQRVLYYRSTTKGYTAIGLPYADKSFVMYFVKPNDAHCPLATLIENLTAAELGSMMRESVQRRVDCKIPRVELSLRKNLNAQLRNFGIRSALKNDSANFGNIFEDADVYLYSFGHTSNIKISEDGLVHNARMITLISEGEQGSSENERIYSFVLDRPFLVILYHSVTNAILAYGAVYNPLG